MNKYFCTAPFSQLEISTPGTCKVCCKMSPISILDDNGRPFKLQESDIQTIWNSKWYNNFRQRFINEEKRPECHQCWSDEDAGIVSLRQQLKGLIVEDLEKPRLTELVLKLSNKCNCACRICSWYLSSLWESEYKKDDRLPKREYEWFSKGNDSKKITPKNWDKWKEVLQNIEHLSLYGGEPLINPEVLQILEYLVEIERSHLVSIGLNTNGTVTSDKMFSMLSKFSSVNLHFSIDDVGERYDYERWPAKWEKVSKDLERLHNFQKYDNITIFLYTSISVLNIMYLNNVMKKFREFNQWQIHFDNIIFEPEELCLWSIPESVKPKVEEYLNSMNWNKNNWFRDKETNDNRSNIINFMYLRKSRYSCKEYINLLDDYLGVDDKSRNQNWKETFSKFYQLLLENI